MNKQRIMLYFIMICRILAEKLGTRKYRNLLMRKKLAPYEFSILSNNCIGGVFLHDAGKRFNSPLVNLAIDGEGFMQLLETPSLFINGGDGFEEYGNPNINYPQGKLRSVIFNFVHYETYEDAIAKWKRRASRFLWNNVYVIATGHDGLERDDLMKRFDELPYKNKIMFTFGKWNYSWAHQVKRAHGICRPFTDFASLTGKRFYETAFDVPSWIVRCEKQIEKDENPTTDSRFGQPNL